MSTKTKEPKYQKNIVLKTENVFNILNEPDEEEMLDEEQESHNDGQEEHKEDFPHGIYDLSKKTVNFNGVEYQYDDEYLFCGQEPLNPVVIDVMKEEPQDNYPQGVNFCKQVVSEQQAKGGKFFILTKNDNENKIHFIFPINSLLDLQLVRVSCHLFFEIEKIDQHLNQIETEFKDDRYPQGKDYCIFLLKEKIVDNYGIHSITKFTEETKAHYYFRYKFNADIPKEKVRFFAGKVRYDSLSKLINKNPETFPQGKQYCLNAVQKANENDSAIFVVGNNSETSNFLLIDDEIEQVCDREWWPSNYVRERRLIKERKTTELFPQGMHYIFDLLQKQQEARGKVRVLKLATPETVWFYIKGK